VPQVDWREVLREFISSTCSGNDYSTWRKPNRRFISAGIYLPSGISEKIEGVVVAGDMSGSIGQREQSVIITEAKSCFDAVKPSWVRMLYWDTKVVGDEKYEHDELDTFAQTTKPVGGGGTDIECVPPYMAENNINPQAVIVITDGYLFGGWGKWSCPVLWVIIDNKDAHPPVGKCVHVTSEELTR
jgi:predicted metal-dependent peptidase